MKKKFLFIPIIIIIVIVFGASQTEFEEKNDGPIFHITLANPELYQNGVFSDTFMTEEGDYYFRFVPNGDSPRNLTISLKGDNYEFSENFELKGTLHETGISEYYTWDYEGQKIFQINAKEVEILINPNGNVKGSVSVDIIKN